MWIFEKNYFFYLPEVNTFYVLAYKFNERIDVNKKTLMKLVEKNYIFYVTKFLKSFLICSFALWFVAVVVVLKYFFSQSITL